MTITDKRNNSMDPDDDGDEVEVHTRDPFQLELLDAVRKRRSRVTGFNEDEAKSVPRFDAAKNSKLSKFMAKGSNEVVERRENTVIRNSRPTSLITENDKWTPSINLDDSDDEFFDDDDFSDDEYDGFETSQDLMIRKPRDGLKRTSSNSDYKFRDPDLTGYSRGVRALEKENYPLATSKSNIVNNMNGSENFRRSSSFGENDIDRKSKKSKYDEENLRGNRPVSNVSDSRKLSRQISKENERSSQSITDVKKKHERDLKERASSEQRIQGRGQERRRSSSVEEKDVLDSSLSKSHRKPVPTPRKRTDGVSPRSTEHQGDEREYTKEIRREPAPARKSSLKSPRGVDSSEKQERKSVVDFEIGSESSDDEDAFRDELQSQQKLVKDGRRKLSTLKETSVNSDKSRRVSGSKEASMGSGTRKMSSESKGDGKEPRKLSGIKSTGPVRTPKDTKSSLVRTSSGRKVSDQSDRQAGTVADTKVRKLSKEKSLSDAVPAKKRVVESKVKSPRRTSSSRLNSTSFEESMEDKPRKKKSELFEDQEDLDDEANDTLGASFREVVKSKSVNDFVDHEQQALDDIFSTPSRGDQQLGGKRFGRQLSLPEKKSVQSKRGLLEDDVSPGDDTLKPRRKSGARTPGSIQSPRGKTQTPEATSLSRKSSATPRQRASVAGPAPNTFRPKSGRRISEANVSGREQQGPVKAVRSENFNSAHELERGQNSRRMSRKMSTPVGGRTRTSQSPRSQMTKTPSPNASKTTEDISAKHQRSQSFNNISNIKPSLTKSKAKAGDSFNDSKSIRDQIYQEWLTRKTSVVKQQVRAEKESSQMEKIEKSEMEKSRKIEVQKAFEAWNSTKAEKLQDIKKTMKEKKLKEKEKEDELLQKKLDAKKYFESWKSSKDEVLKDKYKKTRVEERQASKHSVKEKEQKQEDAKKVYDNWKAKKEEQLKDKRAKDLQKTKEQKIKGKLETERKEKAQEVYEKWKETKPVKPRSTSTTLVQRPWCPSSRFSTNAIPERVQPVVQAGTANRARSATYARQTSATRKLSNQ